MSEALEVHLHRQIEHSRQFFWQRLRWRAVSGYLPDDAPFDLVDVGAGAGLLGTFLARDRPQASYRFVEPIDSLRQFLCERFGNEADAANEPNYGTAGFVTLLDVLEHQEDDRAFLGDLVGKMAPGSTLLCMVPALPKLWSQWDVTLGHFRRYEKATLLTCTEGLRLSVHETSFLFPELVPVGMLRKRRRVVDPERKAGEDAEFPDLPGFMNDVLYGLGRTSLALRRRWWTGTSLFMAATVEG